MSKMKRKEKVALIFLAIIVFSGVIWFDYNMDNGLKFRPHGVYVTATNMCDQDGMLSRATPLYPDNPRNGVTTFNFTEFKEQAKNRTVYFANGGGVWNTFLYVVLYTTSEGDNSILVFPCWERVY